MFVFDPKGALIKTLTFPYTGWGLTTDGTNLILTDGTPTLRTLNPADLSLRKEIQIKLESQALPEVNELEWVNGKIFANLFQTDRIVRIDPVTGCVDGVMDASKLRAELPPEEIKYLQSDTNYVLNGIAYDAATKEMYLTGKNWKYIFVVKVK